MATVTLVPQRCAAQMPIKYNMVRQVMPDSTDLAYYGKKHFWRAAGEVVGFNIGLGHLTDMCNMETGHISILILSRRISNMDLSGIMTSWVPIRFYIPITVVFIMLPDVPTVSITGSPSCLP